MTWLGLAVVGFTGTMATVLDLPGPFISDKMRNYIFEDSRQNMTDTADWAEPLRILLQNKYHVRTRFEAVQKAQQGNSRHIIIKARNIMH
ncbi:hypothetical protein RSOLAG1IB_05022 [Rhizoctonia solani AG-1 IB]|uniref:Uncharacterized protein n=1 Tax=Thanatephorus cucumeris (strain AG1-IB / isolate 7/3/14) TaxID=1108050 RepID=A0A0B7FXK4_THACB|nr:hypothetical protein RSOLAG1IB_05022 [Rhizoctonia solani AG-1 IB]